ncbi:hypothetical protein HDU76_007888, partial [Blyttiomyces sp. JEL0837]
MSKGKEKDFGGVTIEDDSDEEFDVDNMDFDLPAHLVGGGSSGYEPLLMSAEEAAEMSRTVAKSSQSSS